MEAIPVFIETRFPIGRLPAESCRERKARARHETMPSDAERLARNAAEAGVDVLLHVYEGMPHGFSRFETAIGTQAVRDMAHWCRARLAVA